MKRNLPRSITIRVLLALIVSLASITIFITKAPAYDDEEKSHGNEISAGDWGAITAPVFGTHEAGSYSAAELFAGPNKFGGYFAGVLPNGRIVKPAGTSIQIGMNPLGAALTPDGKFLITSNDDERDGG